ncbi:MAG: serine/threonine-protein phosphatase, partial [Streptosporangiaceae bacterium]|nr:serine/threonine-protein phosphatase [Streptosporangiaceae bacterium]
ALRVLCRDAGGDVHRVLAAACGPVPAWDPVVYLADFSRQVLIPLAAGMDDEEVAGTLAGRAFTTGQPVTSPRDGGVRVWVPVLEQTTRTGVLAVTLPEAGAEMLAQAELLGVFAGLVTAMAVRVSDTPWLGRRGERMSLPAGMQWDLLPPLTARTGGAVIAGVLEPAYDIAGDAFDYAVGDGGLHFAIIDGMGHGIGSTLLTGLAVGAYRHARRGGAPLPAIHAAIDQALSGYYQDLSFATGIIAWLDTGAGRLAWSCAGHPPPLLLRGRKVVAELTCDPALPFGLGGPAPQPGTCDLEPGDAVLLYTDGVIEARTADGELFGLERLTDLAEREAAGGQPGEELVRRLVLAVLDHQAGGLRDDATLILVQWAGP